MQKKASLLAFTAAVSLCVFGMAFPTVLMAYLCQALCFLSFCAMLTVAIAGAGSWRAIGITYCCVFATYSLWAHVFLAGLGGGETLPFFPQPLLEYGYDAIFGVMPPATRQVVLSDPFGSVEIAVDGGQSLDSPYSRPAFYQVGTLSFQMMLSLVCCYIAREVFLASHRSKPG